MPDGHQQQQQPAPVEAVRWACHLPKGAPDAALGLLDDGTLPRAWAARWKADPARPVLWLPGEGWVTGEDLERSSARVAARLAGAELKVGDRLLLQVRTGRRLVELLLGALRSGIVVVPTNTAYGALELEQIAEDAEVAAVILEDADRRVALAERLAPSVEMLDPTLDGLDERAPTLDESEPQDLALLCYTSGTTGRPKGAMLSHANLLASAQSVRLAWGWTETDRLVLALPLFHVHGLCVGLHGTLLAGGTAVVLPRFDVDAVVDAIVEHEATMFFGVPTMYRRLTVAARARELAELRLCVSGSAPLSSELWREVFETSGQRVLERYGLTETLMCVSNPLNGDRRPGTVGMPLPGVELALADDGEVMVKGPNVFSGYWRRPEATADAFEGGWFKTGDLGAFDRDGYLRILGRKKELIITGGLNVYPREVEDALLEHPHVSEAAVVGLPSEEWGEVVVAFVVADQPMQYKDLLESVRTKLAPYKRPTEVHFMDSLPRNHMGKVQKHLLGPTPSS